MRASDPDRDPVVRELRGRIGMADRAILAAVNARLDLVRQLRRHKLAQGWDFVDRSREEQLLDELARANGGPLSDDGVRALFADVLALTKREVTGSGPGG